MKITKQLKSSLYHHPPQSSPPSSSFFVTVKDFMLNQPSSNSKPSQSTTCSQQLDVALLTSRPASPIRDHCPQDANPLALPPLLFCLRRKTRRTLRGRVNGQVVVSQFEEFRVQNQRVRKHKNQKLGFAIFICKLKKDEAMG